MEILTIDELAVWLKLSRSQVYSMTRKRAQARMEHPLPVCRLNGNIRFRKSDILAWLDKVSQESQ